MRNCADGSVETAAEGAPDAIEKLMAALKQGPAGARVDEVVALPADGIEHLEKPFTVLR